MKTRLLILTALSAAMVMALLFLWACGGAGANGYGDDTVPAYSPLDEDANEYVSVYVPIPPTPEPTPIPTPEPTPEPTPAPKFARIQFAGDILLHTGPIGGARVAPGVYDFRPYTSNIRPFIDGDLAIANMESPVDALGGNRDITSWPLFNAPFEILYGLEYAGFNHLIFANNHTLDRRWEGMLNTLRNFEQVGFTWTGAYATRECSFVPTIKDVNGIMVGVLAYTDSLNWLDDWIPVDMRPYAVPRFRSHVMDDVPRMAEDIARIREYGAEFVIVSLHWGAEYVDHPTNMQRQIAMALVENGADVIMGHHSHTVQPVDWHYREDGTRGLIIYSLGNFVADQIGLNPPVPRTQYGMLVTVNVVKDSYGVVGIDTVEVLPTVFIRDRARVLGPLNNLLPLVNGEVPDFITDGPIRAWGRSAYAHVTSLIDAEFIAASHARSEAMLVRWAVEAELEAAGAALAEAEAAVIAALEALIEAEMAAQEALAAFEEAEAAALGAE